MLVSHFLEIMKDKLTPLFPRDLEFYFISLIFYSYSVLCSYWTLFCKQMSKIQTRVQIKIRIRLMLTVKGYSLHVGNFPQNDGCSPKGFQMNHTLLHMFNYHLPASEVERHDCKNIIHLNCFLICAPITISSKHPSGCKCCFSSFKNANGG